MRGRKTKDPNSTTEVAKRRCPTCGGRGKIVDRRRDALDAGLTDVARSAGISLSFLTRLLQPESDKSIVLRKAIRLAKKLGLTLDELGKLVHPQL